MADLYRPGDPVLTPVGPEATRAISADLGRLDALWARLNVVVLTPPASGSPAEAELQDQLAAYAYDQATTGLRAALDHLRSWRDLFDAGRMPTYAHFSLLRTAHEAALCALWVVEPGIGPRGRLSRGLAAQAADYEERRKIEAAIGRTSTTPPAKLAVDRLSDLLAAAGRLGLTRVNRTGETILATSVPATVDLFDRFEPVQPGTKGQFVYRLYSGYAHAKQWALSLGAQQQAPYDEFGRTIALTQANDQVAVAATRRTVNAVDRALEAVEHLHLQPSTAVSPPNS